MRALFKPEDANKLIVRDADVNEASLVSRFLDIINNEGGSLEVTPTYNGNYEINGLLFSVTPQEEPVGEPTYINVNASPWCEQHLLDIYFSAMPSEEENYTCFGVNKQKWEEVKEVLSETIGATDMSISPNGYINAYLEEPIEESVTILLPAGFLQFVSTSGDTNIYNNEVTLTIRGE